MENKLISVVVPVYNMGKYVNRAVEKLLDQDYSEYEIILVDDGSTDGGSLVCDELAQKNEKIRVVHKKNGGLSSARNCGIDEAKGEYIIFPDPDDWVDQDYLSVLMKQQVNETDLEICGFYLTEQDKETIHDEHGKQQVLSRSDAMDIVMQSDKYCGFAWNKLYHMSIIRQNGLRFDTELGMAQDLHFAFRYIMSCNKISYDPKPVYHYFQHEGGVTNIKAGLTPRKMSGLRTYEKIAELAGNDYPYAKAQSKATIANMCLQFLFIYYQSGMKDAKIYDIMINGLRSNIGHLLHSKRFSAGRKILAIIGTVAPSISYLVWKKK